MLGIVLELFVVEEKLLAGGEYEFSAAIDALQDLILEFHGRLPQEQGMGRNRPWCSTARRSRFFARGRKELCARAVHASLNFTGRCGSRPTRVLLLS